MLEKRYTIMMHKFVGVFFTAGETIYSYDVHICYCAFVVGEYLYSYDVQICWCVFYIR